MKIDYKIDDADVLAALRRLEVLGDDMSPAMRDIAGILRDASEQAFEDEADPATGDPWAPLSPITVARRGGEANPILQVSGDLARIQTDYGPDFAAAGSPEIYAAVQQLGASQGAFGKTKRGGPIPWGDIPARPFLGISEDDEEEILDAIKKHLERAISD